MRQNLKTTHTGHGALYTTIHMQLILLYSYSKINQMYQFLKFIDFE